MVSTQIPNDELNNMIVDIQNEENSSDSDDECTSQEAPINTDDSTRARSSSDNDEHILLNKADPTGGAQFPPAGRLQQHNIVRIHAGPTSYFTSSIIRGIPLSSFRIFFNEPTLKNILKCTTSEAHRVTGKNS